MKAIASLSAVAVLVTGLGVGPAQAEPGGCLKYGAAGAVGGHLAGHGVLGAVGGCAAGAYRRHVYRKDQRAALRQQQENGSNQGFGNNAPNQGFNNNNPNPNSGDSSNQGFNNAPSQGFTR